MYTTLIEFLQQQYQVLVSSEFLPGMLGAGFGTAILYNVRSIPRFLIGQFIRFCSVTVECRNTDESFYWIELYFSNQPPLFQKNFMVSFESERQRQFGGRFDNDLPNDRNDVALSQGIGSQWFFYKKKILKLSREVFDHGAEGGSNRIKEKIIIRGFFCSKKFLHNMIMTARDVTVPKDNKIKIYEPTDRYGDSWDIVKKITKRDINTIFLNENKLYWLIQDIQTFLDERQEYLDKSIPYRRTYLLHGPAGTGKSSIIQALAGHFGYHISSLNLNTFPSDSSLNSVMNTIPNKSFTVIEDIDDFMCTRRNDGQTKSDSKVSFSALLNVLDGIYAQEERILFMTTNHPERLDPALVREGRVNVKLCLGYCDYEQATNQVEFYYGRKWSIEESEFVRVSPALIQELYSRNRKSLPDFESDYRKHIDSS